jgi:hypothetical protein
MYIPSLNTFINWFEPKPLTRQWVMQTQIDEESIHYLATLLATTFSSLYRLTIIEASEKRYRLWAEHKHLIWPSVTDGRLSSESYEPLSSNKEHVRELTLVKWSRGLVNTSIHGHKMWDQMTNWRMRSDLSHLVTFQWADKNFPEIATRLEQSWSNDRYSRNGGLSPGHSIWKRYVATAKRCQYMR